MKIIQLTDWLTGLKVLIQVDDISTAEKTSKIDRKKGYSTHLIMKNGKEYKIREGLRKIRQESKK